MPMDTPGLVVEPKLNALVEAVRLVAQGYPNEERCRFQLKAGAQPLAGMLVFERSYGTATCHLEGPRTRLRFLLRYGAPSVTYTNLLTPDYQEFSCLYEPPNPPIDTLEVAWARLLHAGSVLHHMTVFRSNTAGCASVRPSGVVVRRKFQVFPLPGRRVA
jgi:hypothetical protein